MAISGLDSPYHARDVRLIRDHVTNTSRGFCFVEFNTSEVHVHVHVYVHIHVYIFIMYMYMYILCF